MTENQKEMFEAIVKRWHVDHYGADQSIQQATFDIGILCGLVMAQNLEIDQVVERLG